MSTSLDDKFDPLQQRLHDGAYSIEASAGTGKTYSIALLWLRLLVEQKLQVDQILVTTFTTAATAELKDRLLASLRKAIAAAKGEAVGGHEAEIVAMAASDGNLVRRLETALSNFDLAPIYTIHGFCQSMISRQVLELGADPDVELVTDCSEILDEIVDDELMRQAGSLVFDVKKMRRVARDVSSNPLGTILPRMDVDALAARCQEKVAPFLKEIAALNIPARSLTPIHREIQNACESGKQKAFSATQKDQLGRVLGPLEAVLLEIKGLHSAKAAADYHALGKMVRQEYSKRKSAANLRSFDDILLAVYEVLEKEGSPLVSEIRKRFKAVIVDECQDSDEIQIRIFQRLFLRDADQSLLVIGDPKQSIYRFRGADLASYRGLTGKVNHAPEMKTNYRSDKPLVDALNRIYEGRESFDECLSHWPESKAIPIRYVKVEAAAQRARIFDRSLDSPVVVCWSEKKGRADARRDLAAQVAAECGRLLGSNVEIEDAKTGDRRQLQASDIAVLCAAHKDLVLVRQALQQNDVACQLSGRGLGKVLGSEEAMDVLSWLCALSALERRADVLPRLLSFCATPLVGKTASELLSLHSDVDAQAEHSQGLLQELEGLRWHGPLPLLLRRITSEAVQKKSLEHKDGERRLTNWRQIGSLLQNEWFAGRHGAGELAQWLNRAMGSSSSAQEENMMKLETDLPAVQLATIHSAKGLEYPVVFCPFLWAVKSQTFRDQSPLAILRTPLGTQIDLGSEEFSKNKDRAIKQEDEESQRLLYVALTRARHRVYLGLAPVDEGVGQHKNGAEKSELARLLGLSDLQKTEWLERVGALRLAVLETQIPAGGLLVPDHEFPDSGRGALSDPPEPVDFQHWPQLRCTSYSSLTRSAHEEESLSFRDYDSEGGPEFQSSNEGLLGGLDSSGILLGTEIHSILEEILGNRKDPEIVLEARRKWKAPVETILSATLAFGGSEINLRRVKCLAEMHFLIPSDGKFFPDALSAALQSDPAIHGDASRLEWAKSLAGWTFNALHGYLQGYIDLIFEHEDRWYVADYKSNLLSGYGAEVTERAMLDSHYLLQTRLYTLALHRHLAATLENYDYDRHIGGAAWLFLRGFPDEGVWFERPDRKSVEQLDHLFKGTPL